MSEENDTTRELERQAREEQTRKAAEEKASKKAARERAAQDGYKVNEQRKKLEKERKDIMDAWEKQWKALKKEWDSQESDRST